jgi:hypothetical protein
MKIRSYLRQEWNMYLRNVLLRDKCEFCGSTENLHVHHENRFHDLFTDTLRELEMLELEVKEYPEGDLNLLSNVMLGKQLKIEYKTLCKDCHMKLHTTKRKNGEYAQGSISEYGNYFFINLKELKESGADGGLLIRFIRLCSFMDFSNKVRYGNAKGKKGLATTKDLQEILGFSKNETIRTKNALIVNKLISINEDKTITINKKYATKGFAGEVERNIVFEKEFNKLYERINVTKHKPLGNTIYDDISREQTFKFSDTKYTSFNHKYRSLKEVEELENVFKTKGNAVMFNPQLFFFEGYQDIREMIKRYKEF